MGTAALGTLDDPHTDLRATGSTPVEGRAPPAAPAPTTREAEADHIVPRDDLATAAPPPVPPGNAAIKSVRRLWAWPRGPLKTPWPFSSLLGRIALINLIAIIPFVIGVYWVTVARTSLVQERINALMDQGRIIASALADEATTEEISPPIRVDAARNTLNALARPTGVRARLFDLQGAPLVDTRFLLPRNQVVTQPLPLPGQSMTFDSALRMINNAIYEFFAGRDLPVLVDGPNINGRTYSEIARALDDGTPAFSLRVNANGELIVSVALPVQRLVSVRAVLMLSTEAGDLNDAQRQDALTLFYTALAAIIFLIVLSYALSRNIAAPVKSLAAAADKVRRGDMDPDAIPVLRYSAEELQGLAAAFRSMTAALAARLDAIEQFAADVAHEIKNPLTSIRSAVETLVRTDDPERRAKLMNVIQNDVRRIDRLISDISEASRLDAELSREKAAPVDLGELTAIVASLYRDQDPPLPVRIELEIAAPAQGLRILGREGALAQVLRNIIDNAVSFAPRDGLIRMTLTAEQGHAILTVEDEGEGIPAESLHKVFERFYTHRPPGHGFGKNSGLGLSISKQIVESHGGTIKAANRRDRDGAVFTVTLPSG